MNNATKPRLVIIGTGTIGREHMQVAVLLDRATVNGIYDIDSHSMDATETFFSSICADPLVRYQDLESACSDPEDLGSTAQARIQYRYRGLRSVRRIGKGHCLH